jgi:hypothetical protein
MGDGAVEKVQVAEWERKGLDAEASARVFTPLQKVGYQLALFVLAYIFLASVAIFLVSFRSFSLPPFPAPPANVGNADQYKQLVDSYKASADVYQQMAKAQVERATQLFQLVVASTILPAFTAILGYIFGSKRSAD